MAETTSKKSTLVSLGVVTTIAGGVWIAAVQMTSTWLDRMDEQSQAQREECTAQVERWEGLYTACFEKLTIQSARLDRPPICGEVPAIGDVQEPQLNQSGQLDLIRAWVLDRIQDLRTAEVE